MKVLRGAEIGRWTLLDVVFAFSWFFCLGIRLVDSGRVADCSSHHALPHVTLMSECIACRAWREMIWLRCRLVDSGRMYASNPCSTLVGFLGPALGPWRYSGFAMCSCLQNGPFSTFSKQEIRCCISPAQTCTLLAVVHLLCCYASSH